MPTDRPALGPTCYRQAGPSCIHPWSERGTTMSKRLTEPENAALLRTLKAGYKNGKSVRQLSTDNGVSYGKVHRMLLEAGVEFRPRGGYQRGKKVSA